MECDEQIKQEDLVEVVSSLEKEVEEEKQASVPVQLSYDDVPNIGNAPNRNQKIDDFTVFRKQSKEAN